MERSHHTSSAAITRLSDHLVQGYSTACMRRTYLESGLLDQRKISQEAPPHMGPGPPLNGTMKGRNSSGGIRYTGHVAPEALNGPLLPSSPLFELWPGTGTYTLLGLTAWTVLDLSLLVCGLRSAVTTTSFVLFISLPQQALRDQHEEPRLGALARYTNRSREASGRTFVGG